MFRHKFMRLASYITILALVLGVVVISATADAALVSTMSDTMSNHTVSTDSTHVVVFTPDSGVTSAGIDGIVVDFDDSFDFTGVLTTDALFSCATGDSAITESLNPNPGVATTDAVGGLLTGSCTGAITLSINVVNFIANPGSAGSYDIIISTYTTGGAWGSDTIADTSTMAVPIVDNDDVTITASVDPTMTFDIDTATSDTESATPYTVDLGTLSPSTLTTSDDSAINSIYVDLDTNAGGGAVVYVKGDTAGLNSVLVSKTIDISGSEAAIALGTEGFGLCLESVGTPTTGTLVAGTQYDSTNDEANCTSANGGTPAVGSVETSNTEILNSNSAEIAGGRAEILVKAAISATTPPAGDYDVVLTFSAVATF